MEIKITLLRSNILSLSTQISGKNMLSGKLLFGFLFFLGGFTSLVYQVAWQRVLTQVIGTDSYSVTLIVSIFMAGLGFGGLLGGTVSGASSRLNASYVLAILEWTIGLLGFFSVPLIRAYNSGIVSLPGIEIIFLLNFIIIFVPTLFMGITTPLMVHVFRNDYSAGIATSLAYSANVMGAAFGALISGLVLVGTLGLELTCKLMGILDILIGFVFYLVSISSKEKRETSILNILSHWVSSIKWVLSLASIEKIRLLVIASFIVGFVALGYEIIFFRLFVSCFGLSPYVFPILLFSYLINMAAGTFLSGRLLRRFREGPLFIAFTLFSLLATLPILYLQEIFLKVGFFQPTLVLTAGFTLFEQNLPHLCRALILSLILMSPILFLSANFPLFVNSLPEDPMEAGKSFGRIYFYQTIANTLGSLVTGFILYRFANSIMILKELGVALVIAAILFAWNQRMKWPKELAGLAVLSILILLAIPIFGFNENYYQSVRYYLSMSNPVPPIMVKDTQHGMSLVYSTGNGSYANEAGGRFHVPSYLGKELDDRKEVRLNILEPQILFAVNPKAERGLYIGLGTATQLPGFFHLFPNLDLDVVEINPDVVDIIQRKSFTPVVHALDGANVWKMDGRRFLMHYTQKYYDFIHVGVDRATTPGAGNLFNRDFFQAAANRLTENGCITFWAYPGAVKAATEVFDEVLVLQRKGGIAFSLAIKRREWFERIWPDLFARQYDEALMRFKEGNVLFTSGFGEEGAFVLRKRQLKELLKNVATPTDDLLATEYFLNQQEEIRSSAWVDGKPRDFRIFEPLPGVERFPWPLRDNVSYPPGTKIYDWEKCELSGDITTLIQHSGGPKKRKRCNIIKGRDGVKVQIQHRRFFQHNLLGPRWQWDIAPNLIGALGKHFLTMTVMAEKTGRGLWGIEIQYKDENGHWKNHIVSPGARSLEELSATLRIPSNAKEVNLLLTFIDSIGFGSKTQLNIKRVAVYKHLDEYWRP